MKLANSHLNWPVGKTSGQQSGGLDHCGETDSPADKYSDYGSALRYAIVPERARFERGWVPAGTPHLGRKGVVLCLPHVTLKLAFTFRLQSVIVGCFVTGGGDSGARMQCPW